MKAVTPEVMRALDAAAIQQVGIPGLILMENAARGTCDVLQREVELEHGDRVLVLCGPGNNGGDGFGVARHLWARGADVVVASVRPIDALSGDAATQAKMAVACGVPVHEVCEADQVTAFLESVWPVDVVVDALLGTGSRGEVTGVVSDWISAANQMEAIRVAVDLPTGVDGLTGTVGREAFAAHLTVTLGLPKTGLFLHPGSTFCGDVHVVNLGFPPDLVERAEGIELLSSFADVPDYVERPLNAHKNSMGHLLLVAGSPGKTGAALLGGTAALRAGVGLVTIAAHSGVRATVEGQIPDLMVEGLDMDCHPSSELELLCRGKTAVAVGPGVGTCEEAWEVVSFLLRHPTLPVAADADAITVLSSRLEQYQPRTAPTIFTPHPGEMARLLHIGRDEVQADRLAAARRASDLLKAVVVLKGATTVIAAPDGRMAMVLAGSPALAKAGTGDVLTGLLGALLALGMSDWDAARLGVFLHARCGELLAAELGVHSVTASDVAQALPRVIQEAMEWCEN